MADNKELHHPSFPFLLSEDQWDAVQAAEVTQSRWIRQEVARTLGRSSVVLYEQWEASVLTSEPLPVQFTASPKDLTHIREEFLKAELNAASSPDCPEIGIPFDMTPDQEARWNTYQQELADNALESANELRSYFDSLGAARDQFGEDHPWGTDEEFFGRFIGTSNNNATDEMSTAPEVVYDVMRLEDLD